jgi:wobble nucleotide-excising tRNase
MIEQLTIHGAPPFAAAEPTRLPFRRLNYLFGTNGVGKTTISRIIADPGAYPTCSLTWSNGTPLQTLVLNRDFVDRSFRQMAGIFTLGEEQSDTQQKIEAARAARDAGQAEQNRLRQTLEGDDGHGGKRDELAALESEIKDACWRMKVKYDEVFRDAFKGARNDAQKFKERTFLERGTNTAVLKPYADLEAKAETVFGDTPERAGKLPKISSVALLAHEGNPILSKKVIGKGDVDIAAMIERLNNSDWVRQGLEFYRQNEAACPFCQQSTTQAFAASLEAYFDETYDRDKRAIDDLVTAYAADASVVQGAIERLAAAPGPFLDVEKLQDLKSILDEAIRGNRLLLEEKQRSPSVDQSLRPLADLLQPINDLIATANGATDKHNATIDNLANERTALTAEVWRFVLNELDSEIKTYESKKNGLDKAVASLTQQIAAAQGVTQKANEEIRQLERRTTSVQPTVDAINATLRSFGYTNFSLATSEDGKFYQLLRANGEIATETLSEGEKTFVVFLYFYHLIRGSFSADGVTRDRVVVFDDPVSSLDSNILFIVSSLIRGLCDEVRQGAGNVRQVFALTHNLYFHKEVAFERKRGSPQQRTFMVLRKRGGQHVVEVHAENPIETSYEYLWNEVRRADPAQSGIENTLRRILENYFKILGDIDLDKLHDKFEGADKLICKSLLSWINAGSHFVDDPLFVSAGDVSHENFLRIFKEIFVKMGHSGHYDMMMRSDSAGATAPDALEHTAREPELAANQRIHGP